MHPVARMFTLMLFGLLTTDAVSKAFILIWRWLFEPEPNTATTFALVLACWAGVDYAISCVENRPRH